MKGLILVGLAVLCSPSSALAQAQIVPSNGIKGAEQTDVAGWVPFLGVTATLSLADNSSVVGQVDGFSTLFGLGLTGGADYAQNQHLLRTSLTINEGFARTPVIDEFVKTNDSVKLEGLYSYFLTPGFGLYGRLGIATDAFSATDIRGTPTSWVETVPGGMPIALTTNGFRQRLAGPFSPFTINEQAGGFAEPVRETWLHLSVRAGLGGRHTFADGILVNSDDKATPAVELSELHNVHQLGFELFGGGTGKLDGGKALYKAGLSVLLPVVNNDPDHRSAASLTRVGFEGSLTFNVYSWMGLVYNLKITRDPQLFSRGEERVEVQNTLLLTFQLTLVKKPEKPNEPTPEELEIKAAQDRADAAEKRAQAAEDKLKALQPAPPPVTPGPESAAPPPATTAPEPTTPAPTAPPPATPPPTPPSPSPN
jgi:hypothetical protein